MKVIMKLRPFYSVILCSTLFCCIAHAMQLQSVPSIPENFGKGLEKVLFFEGQNSIVDRKIENCRQKRAAYPYSAGARSATGRRGKFRLSCI